MTQETIVAAFDSPSDAQAAARDLEAAGIPASSITQHADEGSRGYAAGDATPTGTAKQPGFWARLFGTEDDDYRTDETARNDHAVYDRTMAGGGTVLSIVLSDAERDAERVLDLLDKHSPVDIEERGARYDGTTETAAVTQAPAATPAMAKDTVGDQRIQLAEEALVVGKRVVSQGTTRIRRYVVETPVSEDVTLHRETVAVERRPVTGDAAVAADAFTDRTIEVTEMNEEAVVGKTARVVEEVVIRKGSDDRVETVHDTVRREALEVEKTEGAAGTVPATDPAIKR